MSTQPEREAEREAGPRIIRVFPRRTKASPDDELAYFGEPDLFAEADEVHVSVPFGDPEPIALSPLTGHAYRDAKEALR